MRNALIACAAVANLSGVAHAAAFTVYTDRAAFLAAAGPTVLEDFNDTPDAAFRNASLDVGAFTLTDSRTDQVQGETRIGATFAGAESLNGTKYLQTFGFDAGVLDGRTRFTFDAPIRAFGAVFTSGAVGFVQLRADGQSFVKGTVGPGFFGIVSDGAFTDLEVTAPPGAGTFIGLDDVTFAAAVAPVPEPAGWAMMIAGFVLAGTSARRRQPRHALG